MRAERKRVLAYLGTLLAGVGIGACVTERGGSVLPPTPSAQAAPPYSAQSEPIVKAVQKVAPAVVSIDTTGQQLVPYLARDQFDDLVVQRRSIERPLGSGSGVLLEGGYVLTNQHVVGDALETRGRIQITLPDGRRFGATSVGTDRATDVALLKVEGAKDLPVAPLGTDDTLLPGQTVMAIGNPVGLSASVSSGVVSALGRPIAMEDRLYENLIQTDTAINPGNSGGALIDLGGQVVGINTLVRSDAQNIGFSIPIKTAMRVVEEIKRYGKVRRPWTGIVAVDLDPRLRSALSVPDEVRGVLVWNVYPGSPAAEAGLRRGDLVVRLAGKETPGETAFRQALSGLKIGEAAEVSVLRRGQAETVRLTLVEAP